MAELSDELRGKLAALRTAPVKFDEARQCFVDRASGVPKRGLTKILAQLIPVPYDKLDSEEIARAEARTLKPRRSKNDPAPNATVYQYAGSVMGRCTSCAGARSWLQEHSPSERIRKRLAAEPHADKAHGIVIDYQMQLYVRAGGRNALFANCAVVDPCVGTLIEHCDAMGWAVVATQMPLYSAEMDVATAFDLVATDRATRTKLFLLEVKATRSTADLARNSFQYERLRGRLQRTTLRSMPLSFYSRNQVQLFCMLQMVRAQHGFALDSAVITRVSPGTVRVYPLNDYYSERAKNIVRAIALKTGRIGGKKRKRTTQ